MRQRDVNDMSVEELQKLPYLGIAQAARVTGLPVSFVRNLAKEGKMQVVRSGRISYINMASFRDTLAAMSTGPDLG